MYVQGPERQHSGVFDTPGSSRDKQKVLKREGSGQAWAATCEFAHHRSAPFTNHNAVSILVRRRACPPAVGGDRPAGLDQSSQTVSNARPRVVNVLVDLSCVAVFLQEESTPLQF